MVLPSLPGVCRDTASMMLMSQPQSWSSAVPIPRAGYPLQPDTLNPADNLAHEQQMEQDLDQIKSSETLIKNVTKTIHIKDAPSSDLLSSVEDPALVSVVLANSNHTNSIAEFSKQQKTDRRRRSSVGITKASFDDIEEYFARFVQQYEDTGYESIPLRLKKRSFSRTDLCWSTLALNTRDASATVDSLQAVPREHIDIVFSLATDQMDAASTSRVIDTDKNFDEEAFDTFSCATEAAIICLEILTSKGIARELMLSDVTDRIVRFMQYHSSRTLIPLVICDSLDLPASLLNNAFSRFCSFLSQLELLCRGGSIAETGLLSLISASHALLSCDSRLLGEVQVAVLPLLSTCFLQAPKQHREHVFDELAMTMCSRDASRKRILRIFKVESLGCIDVCSAAVLLLLQSMAAKNLQCFQSADAIVCINVASSSVSDPALSCAMESDHFSRFFITRLLQRCFRKGKATGSSQLSRKVLSDFLLDLQLVMFHPSWPASEPLLRDLIHALGHLLSPQAPVSTTSAQRLVAVELLGSCLAFLRRHLKLADSDMQLMLQSRAGRVQEHAQTEEERLGCTCGMTRRPTAFMLDCDECHRWFHSDCVRIAEATIPSSWICGQCQLGSKVAAKMRSLHTLQTLEGEAFDASLHLLLVDYLDSLRSSVSITEGDTVVAGEVLAALLARQTHLAFWRRSIELRQEQHAEDVSTSQNGEIDDMKLKDAFSIKDLITELFNSPSVAACPPLSTVKTAALTSSVSGDISCWDSSCSRLSNEESERVVRVIARSGTLLSNFRALLQLLISGLREKLPSIRSRVLKSLATVLETDTDILRESVVMAAVRTAVQDRAVSVREAAVDLIGKYMLGNAAVAEQYYDLISERIRDRGLSVRKRVIRILRDICLQQPSYSRYVDACVALINHSQNGGESTINFIRKTARQMWFEAFCELDQRRLSESEFAPQFSSMALKLVDIISKLRSDDWMVELIESMIVEEEEKQQKQQQQHVLLEACSDMCSCIVAEMLRASCSTRTLPLVAYLRALRVFCRVRPILLEPHLSTLQPYLKTSSTLRVEEQEVLALVASLFLMMLPVLEKARPDDLQRIEADLRHLILTQGTSVLHSAIPCFCSLARRSGKASAPLQLLKSFEAFLLKHTEPQQLQAAGNSRSAPVRKALLRSLISCGLLVKFFDFDVERAGTSERVIASVATFASHTDESIRRSAIEALCLCFSGRVRSMLEYRALLHDWLSPSAGSRFNAQALHSISEFLRCEDVKLQYRQQLVQLRKQASLSDAEAVRRLSGRFALSIALNSNLATSILASTDTDTDTDAGIVTGVVQDVLSRVLLLSQSGSAEVRGAFLALSGYVVAQRLVNPVQCIAALVSLCSDRVLELADLAFAQLHSLCVTYPSLLRTRLAEGIELAFQLQRTAFGSCYDMFAPLPVGVLSGVSRVLLLLHAKPAELARLLNELLSRSCVFSDEQELGLEEEMEQEQEQEQKALKEVPPDLDELRIRTQRVAFISLVISHPSLLLQGDDTMLVIRHLGRLIGVLACKFESYLHKTFLSLKQLTVSSDGQQKAALCLACEYASRVSVLLLLKANLQKRCGGNAPSGSISGVKQRELEELSLTRVPRANDDSLEALYRQYAFFKAAMDRDASVLDSDEDVPGAEGHSEALPYRARRKSKSMKPTRKRRRSDVVAVIESDEDEEWSARARG